MVRVLLLASARLIALLGVGLTAALVTNSDVVYFTSAGNRAQRHIPPKPFRERRRTVADDLFRRVKEGESFWTSVYPLYMQREITKGNVREVVRRGLEEARGNYKIVARMFNMGNEDYKRFLSVLRKYQCHVPFQRFRTLPAQLHGDDSPVAVGV